METLDRHLCAYVENLWTEGDQKAWASDAISGVQHLLMSRRCFPNAWQLVSVWSRNEMPARAPPLPASILMAMAGLAYGDGDIGICAGLLLGYHCILRTAELCGAEVGHIRLGDELKGVIALPLTKIGQQRGATEMVTIDDQQVGHFVALAQGGMPPTAPLIRCTTAQFRRCFDGYLERLKLTHAGYRPYSIRRGGATHDFRSTGDVTHTLFRGRWASTRVARIYITDGLAVLDDISQQPSVKGRIAAATALLKGRAGRKV